MTAFPTFPGSFGKPGVSSRLASVEQQSHFGREHQLVRAPAVISSTARDNILGTPGTGDVTLLRPGLALGQITSSGELKQWDLSATDGSQYLYGFLEMGVELSQSGTNVDKWSGAIIVGGNIDPKKVRVYGEAAYDVTDDSELLYPMLAQGANRFLFAGYYDFLHRGYSAPISYDAIDTAGAATLTVADTHKVYYMDYAGAMTVTLPTAVLGTEFTFINTVDQDLTIDLAGGVIFCQGDAAATEVTYVTSSEKIGAHFKLIAQAAGEYLFVPLSTNTMTPTT